MSKKQESKINEPLKPVFVSSQEFYKNNHKIMIPQNHPEIQENEVFIGNLTVKTFEQISYETKRIGVHAYDKNGIRI